MHLNLLFDKLCSGLERKKSAKIGAMEISIMNNLCLLLDDKIFSKYITFSPVADTF